MYVHRELFDDTIYRAKLKNTIKYGQQSTHMLRDKKTNLNYPRV